ncbi:unnamed protein product [Vitrella brassicaformis CCMP3155]|uniref:Uncharacterized protein n=1 Tax=Vitrella brassicaformis (strain CCMP3155) TaxID=1169540 RepID=A0A0G4H5P8_VITBC|nr:unnamed protein product [Vitrella brassicaformis CCMP3155]|eukprot:CEM39158.1 unnamed protein product [Vitrella brassicaformis CCMP3155]
MCVVITEPPVGDASAPFKDRRPTTAPSVMGQLGKTSANMVLNQQGEDKDGGDGAPAIVTTEEGKHRHYTRAAGSLSFMAPNRDIEKQQKRLATLCKLNEAACHDNPKLLLREMKQMQADKKAKERRKLKAFFAAKAKRSDYSEPAAAAPAGRQWGMYVYVDGEWGDEWDDSK